MAGLWLQGLPGPAFSPPQGVDTHPIPVSPGPALPRCHPSSVPEKDSSRQPSKRLCRTLLHAMRCAPNRCTWEVSVPVAADASVHSASVTRLWSDTACVWQVTQNQRPLLIREGGVSERTVEDIRGPKAELLGSEQLSSERV